MKRWFAMFLAAAITLSMAACTADKPAETTPPTTTAATTEPTILPTTEPTTEPSTAPTVSEIVSYPLHVEDKYSDLAVSIPKIIYNTTGSENGLPGNIYLFEGYVEQVVTTNDDSGAFVYTDAHVRTDNGLVTVSNMFKTIYDAYVSAYGAEVAASLYPENISDYVLPQRGETARFIAIYIGYSNKSNMPVFYLGACESLYEIADLQDPTDNIVSGNQTPVATEPAKPQETNPPATTAPKPTDPPATTTPPKETEPPATTQPPAGPTKGEQNALKRAKEYLRVMPFSHQGLIEQLEYEGFTTSEATYAADNCGADWNEQALKKAKDYLALMPFSYSGLIKQLQYEDYTKSQASYGADNCGADWYEQAVKAAKNYLDLMSFSRSGLISQLEYEGFTHDQAVYGAEQNGL